VWCVEHGAFLGRKFDMKERISTFSWDRLGIPPRLKKIDLKRRKNVFLEKKNLVKNSNFLAHSGGWIVPKIVF
jgi:hypothetical protein